MNRLTLCSLQTLSAASVIAASLALSACGKPAEQAAAPAAAPAASAQAAAPAAPAAAAEKKDAIDPLAHEGVPGLSDLFSKKKEGGGH